VLYLGKYKKCFCWERFHAFLMIKLNDWILYGANASLMDESAGPGAHERKQGRWVLKLVDFCPFCSTRGKHFSA
jgi:hypothetical protein